MLILVDFITSTYRRELLGEVRRRKKERKIMQLFTNSFLTFQSKEKIF